MTITQISVEEAKQKLGEKGIKMKEAEVQALLDYLYSVCSRAIDYSVQQETYDN